MSTAAKFDWSKRHILVLEDDSEALGKLRAIFAPLRLGALEVVRDGGQVLAAMKRNMPSVILMEANPRGTDGLDTLRAIRGKDSPNPDVIVAVMVAVADAERLRRMCGIGIESFIRKPVVADVLVQRVQAALLNPQRFISSLSYFGPDRRKQRLATDPPYLGLERRRVVKAKEAPPPPRGVAAGQVPQVPLARRSEADVDDKDWFEAPATPDPPPMREDIPLVDEPPPPRAQGTGAIEVRDEPKRADNAAAWAEAMAPEEEAAEEEAGFDVKSMVSEHSDWIATGGTGGTKAIIENLDLSGANLAGVNLSGATLRNVRLSSANLRGAVLQSTDLRGSDLSGADLTDGDLTSSNLRRVDLSSATLANARLAGTDLAGASLRGADLSGTDLRGANLLDADIASTDLSAVAGLVQPQINKARPNRSTVLPPGLRPPPRTE